MILVPRPEMTSPEMIRPANVSKVLRPRTHPDAGTGSREGNSGEIKNGKIKMNKYSLFVVDCMRITHAQIAGTGTLPIVQSASDAIFCCPDGLPAMRKYRVFTGFTTVLTSATVLEDDTSHFNNLLHMPCVLGLAASQHL
jgi:hypothetical protein